MSDHVTRPLIDFVRRRPNLGNTEHPGTSLKRCQCFQIVHLICCANGVKSKAAVIPINCDAAEDCASRSFSLLHAAARLVASLTISLGYPLSKKSLRISTRD